MGGGMRTMVENAYKVRRTPMSMDRKNILMSTPRGFRAPAIFGTYNFDTI